jgi:ferredoxin-NADP reductase/cytochrome b involved in lipid metabolism
MADGNCLGLWATKQGHIVKNWKRRFFVCDSNRRLVTYWITEEAARANARNTAAFRGQIEVRSLERKEAKVTIVDRSGKIFFLSFADGDGVLDDAEKLESFLRVSPAAAPSPPAEARQPDASASTAIQNAEPMLDTANTALCGADPKLECQHCGNPFETTNAKFCTACGQQNKLSDSDQQQSTAASQHASLVEQEEPATGILMAEVRRHNSASDAWTVLDGKVYNITPYMSRHPGGRDQLLRGAGLDMSFMFREFHPWVSSSILDSFFVGDLQQPKKRHSPPGPDAELVALDPEEWRDFPLLAKEQLNKDSWRFTFGLPEGKTRVGLERVCEHLQIKTWINQREIVREYTPTSTPTQSAATGTIELVVKVYVKDPKNSRGAARAGNSRSKRGAVGKMGRYMASLTPGQDCIEMRGPFSSLALRSNGTSTSSTGGSGTVPMLCFGGNKYPIDRSMSGGGGAVASVGLIAAGSGITPMFPLLYSLLEEEQGLAVNVSLLYCCHSPDEIMLRPMIDGLVARHSAGATDTGSLGRLTVIYVVSEGGVDGDHMRQARLSQEMLAELMPPAAKEGPGGPCICFCGPPGFNSAVESGLHQLGHRPERMHQF